MIAENLLLVSNDRYSSKCIKNNLLKKKIYNIDIVDTGTQALQRLKIKQPNLVLLDFSLPDMSGIEVCKEIRKTSSVPIFLLSSETGTEVILTSYEAGINDYIIKPFNETIIASKIYANLKRNWQLTTELAPRVENFKYKKLEIDMTIFTLNIRNLNLKHKSVEPRVGFSVLGSNSFTVQTISYTINNPLVPF